MSALTLPGWRYFPRYMIVAMLLVLAVNVRFIVIAVATFPGAASNDDFDTSNRYNAVMAAAAAQDALGWTTRAAVDRGAAILDLTGPDKAPIPNATVRAKIIRPLGTEPGLDSVFQESAPGHYVAATALPGKGQYDLQLHIAAQGHDIRVTRRIVSP